MVGRIFFWVDCCCCWRRGAGLLSKRAATRTAGADVRSACVRTKEGRGSFRRGWRQGRRAPTIEVRARATERGRRGGDGKGAEIARAESRSKRWRKKYEDACCECVARRGRGAVAHLQGDGGGCSGARRRAGGRGKGRVGGCARRVVVFEFNKSKNGRERRPDTPPTPTSHTMPDELEEEDGGWEKEYAALLCGPQDFRRRASWPGGDAEGREPRGVVR